MFKLKPPFKVNSIFYIALPLMLFGGYALIKPDKVIDKVMTSLSKDTYYHASKIRLKKTPFTRSGKLKAFYSCMKKYRHIIHRKSTVGKGEFGEVDIKINENVIISLGVLGGEAYSFSIELIGANGSFIDGSDRYSINCDLSLLNKDKSMRLDQLDL